MALSFVVIESDPGLDESRVVGLSRHRTKLQYKQPADFLAQLHIGLAATRNIVPTPRPRSINLGSTWSELDMKPAPSENRALETEFSGQPANTLAVVGTRSLFRMKNQIE